MSATDSIRIKGAVWLAAFMLLALAIRTWASLAEHPTFDAAAYLMYARNILKGQFFLEYIAKGINHYYPPGFPMLIAAFSPVFPSLLASARAVNAVFGALLIVPVYLFVRSRFDQEAAVYSAAMLAVFPLLVESAAKIYSEPAFLFFYTLALTASFSILEKKPGPAAFIAGLLLGAAYMVRTQAVLGMISLLMVFAAAWLVYKSHSFKKLVAAGMISLAGFMIPAIPYNMYLKSSTGGTKFGGKINQHFFHKAYRWKKTDWYIWFRSLNEKGDKLVWIDLAEQKGPVGFIREQPRTYAGWVARDAAYMLDEVFLSQKFLPLVIAVPLIANIIARRREKESRKVMLFLACWFFPVIIITPLTAVIVDRYFAVLIPVAAVAAAPGVTIIRREISSFAEKRGIRLLSPKSIMSFVVLIILASFPHQDIKNSLARKKQYEAHDTELAQWLGRHLPGKGKAVIMSSKPLAAYLTGQTWRLLPVDSPQRVSGYARFQGADLVLVDRGTLEWLRADQEEIDLFFSGESLDGMEYLERKDIPKDEKKSKQTNYVLFRVVK